MQQWTCSKWSADCPVDIGPMLEEIKNGIVEERLLELEKAQRRELELLEHGIVVE